MAVAAERFDGIVPLKSRAFQTGGKPVSLWYNSAKKASDAKQTYLIYRQKCVV